MTDRQPLDFYLNLKYPITLYPGDDDEGGYTVAIKDLPGCMTQAETAEEAVVNIEECRRLWLETAHEHGDEIPIPTD